MDPDKDDYEIEIAKEPASSEDESETEHIDEDGDPFGDNFA